MYFKKTTSCFGFLPHKSLSTVLYMYFVQCPCNLRWRRCRWWGENLHGRVLHDSLIIPTLTIFSFILHSLLFSASCSWNLDFFSSHENERSRLSSYDDEEQEHIMLPSLLKIINNVARCYFWFRQQHHQGLKGRVVIVRFFPQNSPIRLCRDNHDEKRAFTLLLSHSNNP